MKKQFLYIYSGRYKYYLNIGNTKDWKVIDVVTYGLVYACVCMISIW